METCMLWSILPFGNEEKIIYKIDGVELMLDSDLANLYQVETKRINEAVYRNKDKFPTRISWIICLKLYEYLM